jgi:hypothetical protein
VRIRSKLRKGPTIKVSKFEFDLKKKTPKSLEKIADKWPPGHLTAKSSLHVPAG